MRGVRKRGRIPGPGAQPRAVRRRKAVAMYARFARSNGEMKFHDIDIDDGTVSATGDIQNGGTINIIPQGVLENQRIGRKCTIRSINWRYQVTLPSTASASETADSVRMILYVDKQTNGATATVLNILANANFQSFRALENTGRFTILMDKTHKMQARAGIGGATLLFGEDQSNHSFYKKCNIPIEFDNVANTGVLTTIRTNNLGCLFISQGGFAGVDSTMRLRFSDN